MYFAISFRLSECANTFDAIIRSAFLLIFFIHFSSKKLLIVLILFLLAFIAKFFAGSIPNKFLNFRSLKGLSPTPSLLPISIINDFLGFSLKSLTYCFAASTKWSLNTF